MPQNNPPLEEHSIAIIGSGSWATALVKVFTDSKNTVFWYVRTRSSRDFLQTHYRNKNYLKQLLLQPGQSTLSGQINEVILKSKWIIFALPAAYLEETVAQIKIPLSDKFILSGIKGLLPKSKTTPANYFIENLRFPKDQFLVLSGPSHAEEVASGQPVFLTLGCTSTKNAQRFRKQFKTATFRMGLSSDIFGIEYAGVLKNIYAIAAGITKGLNLGDNFLSILMSNALREMDHFLDTIIPASSRRIYDTVYLGDLMVTAYSEHSRNRKFGEFISKGINPYEIQQQIKMVAEGYRSVEIIYDLKQKYEAQTPILDCLYNILYQSVPARIAFQKLNSTLS